MSNHESLECEIRLAKSVIPGQTEIKKIKEERTKAQSRHLTITN